MIAKYLEIDVGFEREPTDNINIPELGHGGLRVSVNDEVLTRWADQNISGGRGDRPRYDSDGNRLDVPFHVFKGEFIATIIFKLLDTLVDIRSEDGHFPEQYVDLTSSGGGGRLVISYLDGEHVRLAFQRKYGRDAYNDYPPMESLVGYAVDLDNLCLEAIEVAEEYLTFAGNAELTGSTLDDIEEKLAELEQLVE